MAIPAEQELLAKAEMEVKSEVDKEDGALSWDFGRCKDMKTAARKRLVRDLLRIEKDPPPGVSAAPQDGDIMSWRAVICGPDFVPWEGATFKLTLKFTEEYPLTPPVVRFVSTMFHPNIYEDGHMDLDVIRDLWNPVFDVAAILLSIQCMLSDPDLNDPANEEAAKILIEDQEEYISRVRETVEKSWIAE